MRLPSWSFAMLLVTLSVACQTPETAKKDMLRDARVGCENGSGSACFQAGMLYAETGHRDRAEASHLKGCSLRSTPSCEALAAIEGPDRERVLGEACAAGDLLSCTRLADVYQKNPTGSEKSKALLEQVCRAASAMTHETHSRDLQGAAAGCAKLATLHASGDGKPDVALATRLDILATLLYTEALFRLEKQEDAAVEREIATRPATATDKDRTDREDEASRRAREVLLQSLDAKAREVGPDDSSRGSTPLTRLEEIFGASVVPIPRPEKGTEGGADDDATTCKDTGDPFSCVIATAQLEKADPAAALQLHLAGCGKRPDQCWSLIAFADTALRKHDVPRATQMLEKGCELKSARACTRLATELEQGERGISQDSAKAARYYDKGCELGNARACLSLASMADDGRGTGKNPARAKQLRAKADALESGPRPPAPPSPALANDEQACRDARAVDKCLSAATAYQDTDAVKAEELHRIACSANKTSCRLWAFALERIRHDDASRGTRLLEQGCQEGSATACITLAEVVHLAYRGVTRAEAHAAELYQRACETGEAFGCRVTASRFRGVKNPQHADELRDQGQKAEDADHVHVDGERWAAAASEQRQRGPQAQELAHAISDWKLLVDLARARSQARAKKLDGAYTGHQTPPVPPLSKGDTDASAAREATIRRNVGSVFQRSAK
jgi:TPR repeat protein